MVIAERLRHHYRFGSPLETAVLEKKQEPALSESDIFSSSDNEILTVRGERIQRILIEKDSLLDSQISQGRRDEIVQEIKDTCDEVGLSNVVLPDLDEQFNNLVRERELKLKGNYPVYQRSATKEKRNLLLSFAGVLTKTLGISRIEGK